MAIYFFDKNQDLIKIVPDSATFEAIQTQELDDDSLLKDTLSVKIKGDERLLNAEYMAVKSYEGNDQAFDMYRIVTDTTPDKTMSFTGMGLAPYELNGHIIQDLRPANHSLEYTLTRLLADTDWRLGHIDSDLNNVTTTFYYVSVKEALKELQSLVGCEFVFKVEISGQKITDKWVEVYREMGNRTKKRFNYGTNALTVVRETNKADIYTALIGRGKGEEVSSSDQNDSGQAGYGRKVMFEDIEWSIEKGNPLDKPIGQYYLELPQATLEYGMRNVDGTVSPRIGIVEFNDEEDPANLLRLTYEQLKVSARPKVLFKSTVANIGATGIGDTVTIHRHDLNMHYETRVRKVVRNKLNDNKTQIELGDAVVTPSTKIAKQNNATIKNLKQELERAQQEFTETRLSADGKTNNHYGQTEPERKRTGDTWFRPHPSIEGEYQMLTWNGEAWELILDTSDTSKVERELEEVIKPQLENMTASIAEAETKANNALEKVDVNTNLISEHKKTLDDINNIKLPNLTNEIGEALDSATSMTESVVNDLVAVRNTANDAFDKANANGGKLTTFEQTVDELKGEISQKVTSADVSESLNTFAQNIRTETAASLKSVYTKTETNGLLGGVHQKINGVKKTADGNEALIAKIQETPATYLADYQKLINRADLFERTLGTTDSAIGENVSRMVQTSGVIQTEVAKMDLATNTALTSKISQLVDNINLKVSSDDLLSQINVQAGSVLIQSGTNKLNITPETTYIEDATIKSAMIESIEADKITTGTLDAGKIRVINIDANNITANKTSFVQSVWNSIESSIRIDSGGLLSTASDGSQVYLQNGIVGARNPDGATIGQIGYVYDGGSPTYTIQTSWGSNFAIKQSFYDSYTKSTKNKEALAMYTTDDGYSEMTIRMSRINILGDAHLSFLFRHSINGSDNDRLTVNGSESVALRARDSTVFAVSNNGSKNFASLHANLNMQGNTVTNTSDIRLKRDIVNDEIDSLSALMKWQHAGFNYTDPDMNQERQFSVIAQSAPDIAFTGEDGYLQVALNKQVNMTSHALQQHVIKTTTEIESLKAQIASLQEELATLKGD